MGEKTVKVYVASNVGVDYFFFLCKTIERAGYDVTPLYLITEVNYRKLSKSSSFKKIWLRVQMYIFYPLYLIYKGLASAQNSIFVVSSNTFYAPLLLKKIVGFKKGVVIHMLYDLYPDAIEIAGVINVNSIASKTIGKITMLNQRKCDATVYLGEFLKEHAEKRWTNAKVSDVIDISTDLALYKNSFDNLQDNHKLIIHYGGQLGHLHDAVSIIECIKYISASDIADLVEFNFYVSGAQADMLRENLKEYPVKIISAVPSNQWREDIRFFHIGLVSLSPGGASVCLPSKTYGMMAGGMAIMAICPAWSDLASLVKRLDAGMIINNSPYKTKQDLHSDYRQNIVALRPIDEITRDFYNGLKSYLKDNALLTEKRTNAFYGIRENFNIDVLSKHWHKVIQDVTVK
ncbi:glycosyltransferase family protein [Mucilaginibacter ginkgonis]|uniref:Glycosyltransferase involved in cell wall biosynthesis n=1 Tax=Mucilaginibacter ginkgonis TaxID=2682091 RepID=A0A6I4I6U3_9SPHI|nr:hypothetical protein [Mucilaginibacter ginkgonis]QQL50859.1 hypothetical protein GO620_005210 [Mucilaginibacter ginkgonis]